MAAWGYLVILLKIKYAADLSMFETSGGTRADTQLLWPMQNRCTPWEIVDYNVGHPATAVSQNPTLHSQLHKLS